MMILNDHLHDIEKDAGYGDDLAGAISEAFSRRDRRHRHNGFAVLPSQHADYDQIVVIGQNRMRHFEDIEGPERDTLLKRLARDAGYRLAKLPDAKPATSKI